MENIENNEENKEIKSETSSNVATKTSEINQEIVIGANDYYIIRKEVVEESQPKKNENKPQEENSKEEIVVENRNPNLPLVIKQNDEKKKKIIKSILLAVLFIMGNLTIGATLATAIYAILVVCTLAFFATSVAGAVIFFVGILGLTYKFPMVFNEMGTLACILVSIGITCISIFFMVLFIQGIKKFIGLIVRYLNWNIRIIKGEKKKRYRIKKGKISY